MAILDRHTLIALPVMSDIPLPLTEGRKAQFPLHSPVNLAGLPGASRCRVGPRSPFPASLRLIGPPNGEESLLAAGTAVEDSGD